MSTLTADNIFVLIKQLPSEERTRLNQLLTEPLVEQPATKAPLDKRVPAIPVPDRTRDWEWIAQHRNEYAGKWVALEDGQLIAASDNRTELSTLMKAAVAKHPMIHRMSSPDDLPYIGI